jgi:pimeloyl-ACP methyl ester carboxylesterase
MAELFPNSSLIEVADAKTFVSLDDPEAVIEAIAAGAASP